MNGFIENGWDVLTRRLPKERLEKIENEAAKEIFRIRLAELRKKNNMRQIDIDAFSQSGLSKLENRKDMKISTLMEYIRSIGMHLEIKAYPEGKSEQNATVLVKI